jgi:hypothetical protein
LASLAAAFGLPSPFPVIEMSISRWPIALDFLGCMPIAAGTALPPLSGLTQGIHQVDDVTGIAVLHRRTDGLALALLIDQFDKRVFP